MTIFNVSSASELNDALSKANGGDEIRLAGGDYGELKLGSSAQFSSEVTIISADPGDPASFSRLRMNDSSNITFDSVVFDYTFNGESTSHRPFKVDNSSDITFTNVVFDGDLANGTGTGYGFTVRGSDGINVIDSEFHSWWKGVGFNTSSNVNFTGNDVHSIRSDGIGIGSSSNVLIADNYVHDFGADMGSDDHRDMLQIKRSGGVGSDDITIRNNVFDMGYGDFTQTIWAGSDNASANDPDGWHTNFVIEGNVIYNAHTHGISVHLIDGIEVTNNTLIAVPRDKTGGITLPKIFIGSESKNVTIEENVASSINGYEGQSGWSVKNNVLIQNEDPSEPGYYADVFVIYATSANDGYNQFGVKPGSIIDQLNAGSALVDLYPAPYEAGFSNDGSVDQDNDDDMTDGGAGDDTVDGGAGDDTVDGGAGDDTGDTGAGDKTGGTGANEGAGDTGGGDDTLNDAASFLDAFDDFVLDIAAGLKDNDQVMQAKGDAHVEFDGADYAIVFDGDGDLVRLGRLEQFEQSEQLAVTVEFARNEADGSEQRIVWNHKKLGVSLNEDGLIVKVGNDEFRVDDLGLNDVEAHRITVLVDQNSDHLQVIVDDMLVLNETEADLDFVGNGGHEWGWKLGTAWGREVDGSMTDFRVDDDVAFIDDASLVSGDPLFG